MLPIFLEFLPPSIILLKREGNGTGMKIVKHHLTMTAVLRFPNFNNPFLVNVDASGEGLGDCLCQSDSK